MDYIIFTDLDGSLLNHEDYSYKEALEMLSFIKHHNIPLVFTTSKTRAECEILQAQMGINAPFIVENGAAIFGLEENIQLGLSFSEISSFTQKYKDEFGLLLFSGMKVEEVMEYTGFDYASASIAKSRDFSEPFLPKDEERLTALEKIAESNGLKILKGGRFYHCVGIAQDKGVAVEKVLSLFPNRVSIALGDNYNDIEMLKVVDIPILIPHHEGRYIDTSIKNIIKAPFKGSLGWNETLKKILTP